MKTPVLLISTGYTTRVSAAVAQLLSGLRERGFDSDAISVESHYDSTPDLQSLDFSAALSGRPVAGIVLCACSNFNYDVNLIAAQIESLSKEEGKTCAFLGADIYDQTGKRLSEWTSPPPVQLLQSSLALQCNPFMGLGLFAMKISTSAKIMSVVGRTFFPDLSALGAALYAEACSVTFGGSTGRALKVESLISGQELLDEAGRLVEGRNFSGALALLDRLALSPDCCVKADGLRFEVLNRLQIFPEALPAAKRYLYRHPTDYRIAAMHEYSVVASSSTRPIVSISRLRQDCHFENPASSLVISIGRQSYLESIQTTRIEVQVRPTDVPANYLPRLKVAREAQLGRYCYIAGDNVQMDSQVMESAVKFMEENTHWDAFVFRADALSSTGLRRELIADSLNAKDQNVWLDASHNGLSPLSLVFFRADSSHSFFEWLFSVTAATSAALAESLLRELVAPRAIRIASGKEVPDHLRITLHEVPTVEARFEVAIEKLNSGSWADALALLDRLLYYRETEATNIDFARAACLAGLHRPIEALRALDRLYRVQPDYKPAKELQARIEAERGGGGIRSFDEVREAFEGVVGAFSYDEGKFMFDHVRALPEDATILEIGSAWGRSTTAIAFACLGTKRKFYTVDTFRNGDVDDTFDVFEHSLRRNNLLPVVEPLCGYSSEILKNWGDRPKVDLVFIDAFHMYEFVKNDYELAFPLVKDGGTILFHDFGPEWIGPWMVWLTQARHDLENHEYCGGLAGGRKKAGLSRPATPQQRRPSEILPEFYVEFFPSQMFVGLLIADILRGQPDDRWGRLAERLLMTSCQGVHQILKNTISWWHSHIALQDGGLYYLAALAHMASGEIREALRCFHRATQVDYPVPAEKVELYRRALLP